MALGALAAAAGGQIAGGLLGNAIAGSRSDDLVDAPVQGITFGRTETSLDPRQLQKILSDLTRAEGIARGDIEGSLDDALATLRGADERIQSLTAPAQQANTNALNQLQATMGLGGQDAAGLQALLEATPGYQFQRDQGRRAVERSGAARGLLESGAILQELERFGQGLASQNFGNYQQQLLSLANATSNQALFGANSIQSLAGAQAGQQQAAGSSLAGIAQQQAAQRASALQQSGKRTTTSQQFNIAGMSGLDVSDLLNEAPGFKGFVASEPGNQKFRFNA